MPVYAQPRTPNRETAHRTAVSPHPTSLRKLVTPTPASVKPVCIQLEAIAARTQSRHKQIHTQIRIQAQAQVQTQTRKRTDQHSRANASTSNLGRRIRHQNPRARVIRQGDPLPVFNAGMRSSYPLGSRCGMSCRNRSGTRNKRLSSHTCGRHMAV